MISILCCAVCEDDRKAAETLHDLLRAYPATLDCDVFFDPRDLLATISKGKRFDLYLLDIVMPSMTGIDLAREIRKTDSVCIVVFLTSSDEYYKDAFQVEAFQYLDKPADQAKLYHTLDRALGYLRVKTDAKIVIQTKDGVHALESRQIVFAESFRHVLTFYLNNGSSMKTLDSTLTLEKLIKSLQDKAFYMPYRGYVINMDQVEYLGKHQFHMTNGAKIPIPQKRFSKVSRDFSDYLLSRNAIGDP